jgi:hypothetical protein
MPSFALAEKSLRRSYKGLRAALQPNRFEFSVYSNDDWHNSELTTHNSRLR